MADTERVSTLDWFVTAVGEDVEFAKACELEATALVDNFVGEDNPFNVPDEVLTRAVLEVGADLYYRKASRNGVVGFGGDDPQPFRLNRDPMAAAYPLLRPFIVTGL